MVLTTLSVLSVTREMAVVRSARVTPAMMEIHSLSPYLEEGEETIGPHQREEGGRG